MKVKSLATAIVAGGLLAAASPSFAVVCGTATADTIAEWAALGGAGCTDTDLDTTWVYVSSTLPGTTGFTVQEIAGVGFEVYNVAFMFDPGLSNTSNGQNVIFNAIAASTEPFIAANYDSNPTEPIGGSGVVTTANILDGALNMNLVSNDGSHAPPPSGESPFGSSHTNLRVTDTINNIPTGGYSLNGINNSFQVTTPTTKIPEPATLLLLGAALAGAGFARRRKQV